MVLESHPEHLPEEPPQGVRRVDVSSASAGSLHQPAYLLLKSEERASRTEN
jgi:hypothetical protein